MRVTEYQTPPVLLGGCPVAHMSYQCHPLVPRSTAAHLDWTKLSHYTSEEDETAWGGGPRDHTEWLKGLGSSPAVLMTFCATLMIVTSPPCSGPQLSCLQRAGQ